MVDHGRPKQLHIKTAEIKEISVTGRVLFESSDKNLRDYAKLNNDTEHVVKVLVGGCFDGASPYQAEMSGVKAHRLEKNPHYRVKHDRMH